MDEFLRPKMLSCYPRKLVCAEAGEEGSALSKTGAEDLKLSGACLQEFEYVGIGGIERLGKSKHAGAEFAFMDLKKGTGF